MANSGKSVVEIGLGRNINRCASIINSKERGRAVGIAAVVLGLGALLIPLSVAAEWVFFLASLVCGSITIRLGKRFLGATPMFSGAITLFDLLFRACLE